MGYCLLVALPLWQTVALLRQTIHRVIFAYFWKKRSDAQQTVVLSMQKNHNRKNLSLESKPHRLSFPNWLIRAYREPVLLYGCTGGSHAKDYLLLTFLLLPSFFSTANGSTKLIVLGRVWYQLYRHILAANNRPLLSDLTECRISLSPERGSIPQSMWICPRTFTAEIFKIDSLFIHS